jgi:hypothetical protein
MSVSAIQPKLLKPKWIWQRVVERPSAPTTFSPRAQHLQSWTRGRIGRGASACLSALEIDPPVGLLLPLQGNATSAMYVRVGGPIPKSEIAEDFGFSGWHSVSTGTPPWH